MKKALKVRKKNYKRLFAPDLSAGMNSAIDSRVLPFGKGEVAVNVSTESGALENGYGLEQTQIPAYGKIFYYTVYDEDEGKDKGFYIAYDGEDGKVYGGADPGDLSEIEGVAFARPPLGTNYRLLSEDVYLLCGEEGMAVIDQSLHAVTVPSAPPITSLAMHNERMFVTIGGRKNAVWFSDDLDPTNWNPELDEGGFIELEGEFGRLNRVVAFGGYVYVFRDYGIARLTAYGDQSEFSVTNLFVAGGKIYADTVAVCGDRILFLAADGLYTFDGVTTVRIARHLDGLIAASASAAGCYSAGNYFLAAKSTEAGDSNDLLIRVDPRTRSTVVGKGMDIRSFSPIANADGERLLVQTDREHTGEVTRCACVFGEPLRKEWRSGMTDFGLPERRKLISEIYVDTKYDCTVTVATEKRSKTFAFAGKNDVQRKRVNLIGSKAQITITAEGDISVARPAVKFCTV